MNAIGTNKPTVIHVTSHGHFVIYHELIATLQSGRSHVSAITYYILRTISAQMKLSKLLLQGEKRYSGSWHDENPFNVHGIGKYQLEKALSIVGWKTN